MAKSNDLFSGGFSGRMGNVIGYMWRGKACVRSMPTHYRDARSEMQLQQRELFRQTIRFASRAQRVLRLGLMMPSLDAHVTEYNYFLRINKRCFSLVDGNLQVDCENLVLSEGPVAPVAFYAPRLLDEVTISIDFEKNPLHRRVSSDDNVYLAAYCPEMGGFDLSAPVARRHNQLVMNLHREWAGKEVHLWGFVRDSKGRTSMSQYIGCGILSIDEWPEPETDESIIDEYLDDMPATYPADVAEATARGAGNSFSRHNYP